MRLLAGRCPVTSVPTPSGLRHAAETQDSLRRAWSAERQRQSLAADCRYKKASPETQKHCTAAGHPALGELGAQQGRLRQPCNLLCTACERRNTCPQRRPELSPRPPCDMLMGSPPFVEVVVGGGSGCWFHPDGVAAGGSAGIGGGALRSKAAWQTQGSWASGVAGEYWKGGEREEVGLQAGACGACCEMGRWRRREKTHSASLRQTRADAVMDPLHLVHACRLLIHLHLRHNLVGDWASGAGGHPSAADHMRTSTRSSDNMACPAPQAHPCSCPGSSAA